VTWQQFAEFGRAMGNDAETLSADACRLLAENEPARAKAVAAVATTWAALAALMEEAALTGDPARLGDLSDRAMETLTGRPRERPAKAQPSRN
jgi:hypothetical protein